MQGNKMKSIDAELLQDELDKSTISYREHSSKPLRIYKYTQECTFGGLWNPITLMCRGLILNDKHEIIANCIPKFFNYEERNRYNIPAVDLNQPFSVTEKMDGSLIQVFMYEGDMIISSSGAFENEYTAKAEQLLNTKYQHLLPIIEATDRVNFVFELIAPLTRVVVSYGDLEELRLITVRTPDGIEDEDFIQQCKDLGFDYVKELGHQSISDIVAAKHEPFNNVEGFVVKFEDGNRIKFKYDEYFILHKVIAHVSKYMVWDAKRSCVPLSLDGIPDETYDMIKAWEIELHNEYHDILETSSDIYNRVKNFETRKEVAAYLLPTFAEYASVVFFMLDDRDVSKLIWDKIKPKSQN